MGAEAEASARRRRSRASSRRRRKNVWRPSASGVDRRNKVVRGVAIVLAGLTVGLVVAVLVARSKTEIADSRGLASSAMAQLPIDPERSVLLATRAVQRRDTSEAKQALRRALAASRVRARLGSGGTSRRCGACGALASAPAKGGEGAVTRRLAIAPDGRTVAAIVGTKLALWHPQAGTTPPAGVGVGRPSGVAFTPDARRVLVIGDRAAALMAPDGTHGVRLPGASYAGATSADGRYVVTAGDGQAVVWDASDGTRVATTKHGFYLYAAFGRRAEVLLQDEQGILYRWRWRERASPRQLAAMLGVGVSLALGYSAAHGFVVEGAAGGKARVIAPGRAAVRLPADRGTTRSRTSRSARTASGSSR